MRLGWIAGNRSWCFCCGGDADIRDAAEAALVNQLDGESRGCVFVCDNGDGAVFVWQLLFDEIGNLFELIRLACVADFTVFCDRENYGVLLERLRRVGLWAVDTDARILRENGRDHEENQQEENHIDHGGHVDVWHGVGLRLEMAVTHDGFSDSGEDAPWRGSLEWRRRVRPAW